MLLTTGHKTNNLNTPNKYTKKHRYCTNVKEAIVYFMHLVITINTINNQVHIMTYVPGSVSNAFSHTVIGVYYIHI